MDDILTELNLETLAAVSRHEIIVPLIVQSMSNEKTEQLGATAIGDRVRLRELCKDDEENDNRSSFVSRSVESPSTSRTGDVYLKLTLYWRNKCVFSILGVLGRSLKV